MVSLTKNDINNLAQRDRIRLINSIAGVKPVNLLGTKSKAGISNLSIISSVFHLGADPALFGFIIRPDISRRDTLNNLRETPYLTLNHVNEAIITQAHQTSARYNENISEFDACELTEEYLEKYPAPFVKESFIKLAAKFIREIKIEENGTHLIICEIEQIHIPQEYLNKDYSIALEKAKSVGVSGLETYLSLKTLGTLSYAKPDQILKWIKKEEV
jgi:flavin reductase (DIM6/NTAB) family NADH-FMN oxidoreductase RutF